MYDISEAARLFGMTPGGLRFYEEAGLIDPERTESGRRKYTDEEMCGLMYLRNIRSMEISLENMKRYFHYDNASPMRMTGEFMLHHVEETRRRVAYYEQLCSYLELYGKTLKEIDQRLNVPEWVNSPDYYLLTKEPLFGKGKKEQEALSKWIEVTPLSRVETEVIMERGKAVRIRKGFGVEKCFADEINLPMREQAVIVSGAYSLHFFLEVKNLDYYGIDEARLQEFCQKIRNIGIEWSKIRLVYRIFHVCVENGVRRKIYEIWANSAENA